MTFHNLMHKLGWNRCVTFREGDPLLGDWVSRCATCGKESSRLSIPDPPPRRGKARQKQEATA